MSARYTIDRFEEGWAVCEGPNRVMRSFLRGSLPAGLREGDAFLESDDGQLTAVDNSAERARIRAKMRSLFRKDPDDN